MTPQERDLIHSVFERLGRLAGSPRDPEAEALITERTRANPSAAYHLVEAVVVQEQALAEAQARIADLDRQLAQLRAQPQQQPRSGGFLSSLFGGGAPAPRPAAPPAYPPQQQAYPQQPYAPQQPAYGANPWGQPQPSAGGSFLRTAAGTAVGVAGGIMLAEGISSMFAGGHQQAMANTVSDSFGAAPPAVPLDTQVADTGFDGGGFDAGGFDAGGFDDTEF